ncbi:aspartic proteinase CDR1-like [Tripterygium wilfordii]|uniref:aspartic proteinase CDR1-like n=1 Tax=Tripterygium wilfordii TaxID=458696 RepID=UPI0018F80D68|nr:aspartic proteinase CDR1-like [Tripterygium wilfordii]
MAIMSWRPNVFLCLSLLSLTTTLAVTTKPQKLGTRLIHYDSVYSPYYNSTATTADRFRHAIQKSRKRLAYLEARASYFAASDDARAGLVADETGVQFMANFSIGTPPIPQLLTIDTASDLMWVQCQPCISCFYQHSLIFDPSKSSTYANLSCNSPSCSVSPSDKCDSLNNCKFSLAYKDGTKSAGIMGTEKLTFQTNDEGETTIDDMVFGCGHDNDGLFRQPSGTLGLSPDSISLVSKLGSKFSYCVGSIRDPNYSFNQLNLGDGVIIEGASTPLELFNNLYYVTLQGISIAENMLNIDPQVFKRTPSGTGGVIIDSGSTITFLSTDAYDSLSDQVKNLLDGKLERVSDNDDPKALCYEGDIEKDLSGFPVVTFHFAGGAELGLEIGSMFIEHGLGRFCMAVKGSDLNGSNGLSVIGIMAQQNYNVAFDLIGKAVYFQMIDCQLLEE